MFHFMSKDAKTLLICISIRNILQLTTCLYDYGSNSGFHVFGDRDRDPWPIFYLLISQKVGMMYWSLHAKFHNLESVQLQSVIWPRTHTNTHTQGKNNSLANPFGARLIKPRIIRRIDQHLHKIIHNADWHYTLTQYWAYKKENNVHNGHNANLWTFTLHVYW